MNRTWLFKPILCVLTLIALLLSNEPFSLFIALIWVFKGLFKLFVIMVDGDVI